MKPHLPIPLLAALVAAIAAPCALAAAPYNNVTYRATATTNPATGNASINASHSPSEAPGTTTVEGEQCYNLADYTGTLSLVGSATGNQKITFSGANGGYGGRFYLTGTPNPGLTAISLSGGTEVDMNSVLASENALDLIADNASFYVDDSETTINSDITVNAGGLRLNGGSSISYTFNGSISGTGAISTGLGNSGIFKFTGNVSGFTGIWFSTDNGRTFQFGDGGACANSTGNNTDSGVVGGTFGKTGGVTHKMNLKFNYSNAYTITGKVYAATLSIAGGDATFEQAVSATTLDIGSGSTAAFSNAVTANTVNINGDADFSGNVTASTVNVNNTATIAGTVNATTLTINSGSNATFSGTVSAGTVTVADGASFTLADTGVYALNGKTVTAHTVEGGTIRLSGTNTFNGTLTANNSAIDIADNAVFSSSSLAGLETVGGTAASYSDSLAPGSGNGYVVPNTFLLIANSGITENRILSNQMGGDLSGTSLEWVAGTGLVAKTTGTDKTYHINSGEVTYGSSDNSTASASKLVLNDGGTLVFDGTALKDGVTLTTHGGTIQVNENISLDASQMTATAATTLTGSGTYVVTTNNNVLNVGSTNTIRLKTGTDGWTGTVTLSGQINNSSYAPTFSNLVNSTSEGTQYTQHSKLVLKGFTGWGSTWNGTEATNFILTDTETDTGNKVLAWTNGASASSVKTCNFTGEFSGDGTFKVTGANQHYRFSGDISAWKGTFDKASGSGTTNLTFDNKAKNVNVAITETSGVLNVVAGADGITFSKDITATSLAMNDNVNATLQGTTTVDTLTLNAGATATLSGNGKVAAGGGKISFEALNNTAAPAIATLQEGDAGGTPAAATGTIENGGATEAVSFSSSAAGSADTTYTNIKAIANSTTEFELLGTLTSSAVVNEGTGAVTVTASGNQDGLYANNGNITAKVKDTTDGTVTLRELSIAEGKAISATIADTQSQATLVVSDVATFGAGAALNATLNANMVLESGVALTLGGALQMGSSALTLNEGIRLGGNLLAELQALPVGGKIDLFTGVDTLTLAPLQADPATYALGAGDISADISMADEVDLGTYFSNVGKGNYFLVYDSQTGTVSAVVPEPATATLGLLALAGLCARRRRR